MSRFHGDMDGLYDEHNIRRPSLELAQAWAEGLSISGSEFAGCFFVTDADFGTLPKAEMDKWAVYRRSITTGPSYEIPCYLVSEKVHVLLFFLMRRLSECGVRR